MSEISKRYRTVASAFTERVKAVPDGAWENPAPCEGWVARDVVRHMVEWMPGFLSDAPLDIPAGPPVDEDPVGAWTTISDALQAALEDPDVAASAFEHPMAGQLTVETAIERFMVGDVLVHTWDLARAAGLDETLDVDEARRQLAAMEPYEEAMRGSDHYGERVDVPAGADVQTRLIAFTGRQP